MNAVQATWVKWWPLQQRAHYHLLESQWKHPLPEGITQSRYFRCYCLVFKMFADKLLYDLTGQHYIFEWSVVTWDHFLKKKTTLLSLRHILLILWDCSEIMDAFDLIISSFFQDAFHLLLYMWIHWRSISAPLHFYQIQAEILLIQQFFIIAWGNKYPLCR